MLKNTWLVTQDWLCSETILIWVIQTRT